MNFSWVNGAGREWRMGCALLQAFVGDVEFAAVLGKRWAWQWREVVGELGRNYDRAMELIPDCLARADGAFLEDRLVLAGQLVRRLQQEKGTGDVSDT